MQNYKYWLLIHLQAHSSQLMSRFVDLVLSSSCIILKIQIHLCICTRETPLQPEVGAVEVAIVISTPCAHSMIFLSYVKIKYSFYVTGWISCVNSKYYVILFTPANSLPQRSIPLLRPCQPPYPALQPTLPFPPLPARLPCLPACLLVLRHYGVANIVLR